MVGHCNHHILHHHVVVVVHDVVVHVADHDVVHDVDHDVVHDVDHDVVDQDVVDHGNHIHDIVDVEVVGDDENVVDDGCCLCSASVAAAILDPSECVGHSGIYSRVNSICTTISPRNHTN